MAPPSKSLIPLPTPQRPLLRPQHAPGHPPLGPPHATPCPRASAPQASFFHRLFPSRHSVRWRWAGNAASRRRPHPLCLRPPHSASLDSHGAPHGPARGSSLPPPSAAHGSVPVPHPPGPAPLVAPHRALHRLPRAHAGVGRAGWPLCDPYRPAGRAAVPGRPGPQGAQRVAPGRGAVDGAPGPAPTGQSPPEGSSRAVDPVPRAQGRSLVPGPRQRLGERRVQQRPLGSARGHRQHRGLDGQRGARLGGTAPRHAPGHR